MNARLFLAVILLAIGSTALAGIRARPHEFRPKWNVGDQWIVETVTRQVQVSAKQKPARAQWQFKVEAREKLAGRDCLRIAIRPTDTPHPKTNVWIDEQTGSIRQIETEIPTRSGYKTVTESYLHLAGAAAPVVGPMTALPIDLPRFPEPGIKSLDSYSYTIVSGPGGTKALGDIGFTTEIRQGFSKPAPELLKSIGGDQQGIKSLTERPLVEVALATSNYSARQVWSKGSPWPLFSDNGVTQARLLKVERAAKGDSEPAQILEEESDNFTQPQGDDSLKQLETSGGMERGTADIKPWSGYWWPIKQGLLLKPLGKYDRLTGHQAAAWERQHNPPGPNVPDWHGYCHAWAAGSILEAEPTKRRAYRAQTTQVALSVGDQKGMLTACHTKDLANSWGDRFGDGQGSEDRQDLRPDLLWRLLKMHLGQRGVPLVLDVESGSEVWNFPVYQYQLTHRSIGNGLHLAHLVLTMADDGVSPSFIGTKARKQTYRFSFEMRAGNVVAGSGKWIGRSTKDHPDFAWYPFKAVPANPELDHPWVQRMVGVEHPTPPTPQPEEQPDLPQLEPIVQPEPPGSTEPTEPTETPPLPSSNPIVLSPIELVALIANQTSSFPLDATIDRFDGASYKPGETFTMHIKSEQPGYLYLIQVDSSGTPSVLYPAAGEDNRIPGGKSVEIRPGGFEGGFPVAGKSGMVRIKSIVVSRPLIFSGSVETVQVQKQQQPTEAKPKPRIQQTQTNAEQQTEPQVQQQVQESAHQQCHPICFRWHPTQRQQIKELLSHKQGVPSATTPEELGCLSPLQILGPFAQDMTMFYLDADAPLEKPQPTQQSPAQEKPQPAIEKQRPVQQQQAPSKSLTP